MTSTVFTLAGFGGSPLYMPQMLGGEITDGNTVVPINYPNYTLSEAQVAQGAQMLNTQLLATPGTKVGFGHSEGSVVLQYWIANYGPTSSINPSDLSFILLGASMNPYGGLCYLVDWFPNSKLPPPSQIPWNVTVFTRQYDGWADWPQAASTNPAYNNLAYENAIYGANNVHSYYNNVKTTDPQNVWYQASTTVRYGWSPTWPVPLLGTTQDTQTFSADAGLRPQIEDAYKRPVTIPNPIAATPATIFGEASAVIFVSSTSTGPGRAAVTITPAASAAGYISTAAVTITPAASAAGTAAGTAAATVTPAGAVSGLL